MDQRCDGNGDCNDGSDEINCHNLISIEGDSLKLPPPPPIIFSFGNSEFPLSKLNLFTSIEVIKILQLDEVHSLLSLQLKLTIEWTDTRHEYIDLKRNENMNYLSADEMNDIWMPSLVFENTINRQQANFRNKSTFATIKINPGIIFYKSRFFFKVQIN
jgi:hypothetical protein